MKRLFAVCVITGLGIASLSGCSDETKVKKTDTVTTPGGKTTVTDEKKVETSGKNPPKAP